jgi:hypothetical protein
MQVNTESQIEQFVDCLFESMDIVEVRRLRSARSTWHKASELAAQARSLKDENAAGQHIYCGANPRTQQGGTKAEDVSLARTLFADFDGIDTAAALDRVLAVGLPKPTLLINSGHGAHAYWRLVEPMSDLSKWTAAQKQLIGCLRSDKTIHDPPRIMRLPGLWNVKQEPHAFCCIVEYDSTRRYLLNELLGVLPAEELACESATGETPPGATPVTKLASSGGGDISEGMRDSTLTSLAGTMRRRSMTQDEIAAALKVVNSNRCKPPLPEGDVERIARSIGNKPAHKPAVIACHEFQPFPVDVLPKPIGTFVAEASEAIGCDPVMIALPLLATLAAAIGNTRRIRLQDTVPPWIEPSVLWTAVVCESGQRKSPAISGATDYLQRLQTATTRHIVSDATREALGGLLAQHPRGLLLVRDELAGWLDFGEYKASKGGDVSFWLERHSAKDLSVDRKARDKTGQQESLRVPSASCSVTGGIQPGALKRAFKPEFFDNGLAARFLLAYPPSRRRIWTTPRKTPGVDEAMQAVFHDLVALDFGGNLKNSAVDLPLTEQAQQAFIDYVNRHGREQDDLAENEKALWSKLEGGAARLALIVHMVRVVTGEADAAAVDEQSIAVGITLSDWFGAEGLRIYDILAESAVDAESRKLVEWVRKRGGKVGLRDLKRGPRAYRGGDAAEQALVQLAKAGLGTFDGNQFCLAP